MNIGNAIQNGAVFLFDEVDTEPTQEQLTAKLKTLRKDEIIAVLRGVSPHRMIGYDPHLKTAPELVAAIVDGFGYSPLGRMEIGFAIGVATNKTSIARRQAAKLPKTFQVFGYRITVERRK